MLRLALVLFAAIYAGLVIVSERIGPAPSGAETISRADTGGAPPPLAHQRPDHLVTADGRSFRIAAVIDPSATRALDGTIPRVTTRTAPTHRASLGVAENAQPRTQLIEVTGNAVNLRIGPSTGDAVLTALLRGEQAELIAAFDDGWVQVRAVETGTVGFLSDRFISPLN